MAQRVPAAMVLPAQPSAATVNPLPGGAAAASGPMGPSVRLVTWNVAVDVRPAKVSANVVDVGEMVSGCADPVSCAWAVPPVVAVVASDAVREPALVGAKEAVTVQVA